MIEDVVVTGAGPAGLAVSACLRRRGIEPVVLDRGERVGDSWRNSVTGRGVCGGRRCDRREIRDRLRELGRTGEELGQVSIALSCLKRDGEARQVPPPR